MMPRRTKLHATLGPASSDEAVLRGLVDAGLDGCRINFSHADAESAGRLAVLVRRLSAESGRAVAIRQDLQGPRLRVGQLAGEPRKLVLGERVILRPGLTAPDQDIPIDCPELFGAVEAGRLILLDEGQLELRVLQAQSAALVCEVAHGGNLLSRKGLNLPGVHLPLPALSAKDRSDLEVGIRLGVDFVALSFVQSAEDVRQARAFLREHGGGEVRLVAKIEKLEAVERIEAILDEVDGISIARGDLGLEVGIENLPHVQAGLIAASRRRGRLVQVGGEVMHTMIQAPRPTRSEVADVALLVAHGVDGISLSGETAVGHDPVGALQILDRIVRRAEQEELAQGRLANTPHRAQSQAEALDYSHRRAAFPIQVAASGREANWLSCHWGTVVETR
jgi:pyruvate kinase